MSEKNSALYWRNAYEELVRQTGRDLNDGLGIDPRKTHPSPLARHQGQEEAKAASPEPGGEYQTVLSLLADMDADGMPNEGRAAILAGMMIRLTDEDRSWAVSMAKSLSKPASQFLAENADNSGTASVDLIRDGDAVCTTCRWKGAHAPDCPVKDEPWPMIEVHAHQDARERIAAPPQPQQEA